MKKQIFSTLFIILSALGLTGCVTEKTRNTILSKLETKNIIQSDWDYLSYDAHDSSPIPDISSYSYYYIDAHDIIHEVVIQNSISKNDGKIIYYPVYINYYLEAYEVEETYTDYETDTSKTHIVTKYRDTDDTISVSYKAYRVKVWFLTFWRIKADE